MTQKYYDEHGNEVTVEGRKPKKRGGCLKWALITIGAFVVLGIIGSMFGGDDTTTESNDPETNENLTTEEKEVEAEEQEGDEPEEAIVVTADEILSAYVENEVNANQIYKGNLVEVTGTLKSISESDSGSVSLVIGADSDELWLEDINVDLEDSSGIENTSTDSNVTVRGIADTGILYTVKLSKGIIVQ